MKIVKLFKLNIGVLGILFSMNMLGKCPYEIPIERISFNFSTPQHIMADIVVRKLHFITYVRKDTVNIYYYKNTKCGSKLLKMDEKAVYDVLGMEKCMEIYMGIGKEKEYIYIKLNNKYIAKNKLVEE